MSFEARQQQGHAAISCAGRFARHRRLFVLSFASSAVKQDGIAAHRSFVATAKSRSTSTSFPLRSLLLGSFPAISEEIGTAFLGRSPPFAVFVQIDRVESEALKRLPPTNRRSERNATPPPQLPAHPNPRSQENERFGPCRWREQKQVPFKGCFLITRTELPLLINSFQLASIPLPRKTE